MMSMNTSVNEVVNKTVVTVIHQQKQSDPSSEDTVEKVVFTFAILTIPVCIFGFIGNILSLFVLVHHRMRNPTNCCLAGLAVSDSLLLLHSLWYSAIILYKSRDPLGAQNLRLLTYPIVGAYGSVVVARITTLLTTLLSIERFVAVYCPIKAKTICGNKHTNLAIFTIYLVTFVLFIPFALKYKAEVTHENTTMIVEMRKTAIGRDKKFVMIYGTILNILFRFVPIALLIILNILIIKAVRHTWSLRRLMSKGGKPCNMSEQNRITVMLLIVSSVFLICILPGALNRIVSRIKPHYNRFGSQRNLFFIVSSMTYFLETINSSINFIIYMAFSAKFCRTYQEMFCCKTPTQVAQASAREIIRFSTRRNESSGSSGSTNDFRLSTIWTDQRKHQFQKKKNSATSSFDMENVRLLGQRAKQSISEVDGALVQYR